MSEQDPETNGGLPPKISLKPKPIQAATPKDGGEAASTDKAAPLSDAPKPAGPKPILLKKPTPPAPAAPTAASKEANAENTPSIAEQALAEAQADNNDTQPESAQSPGTASTGQETKTEANTTATPPAPVESETPDKTPETNKSEATPAQKPSPVKPVLSKPTPTGDTPKRPVLRPAGAGAATIKKPTPVSIPKDAPDPLAAPGTKKSTSRITLPASAEKSTTGEIKTIKIAPKSKTGNVTAAASGAETDSGKPKVDLKRQTSRISLESVLSGGNQSPNAPATIKIKRAVPGATPASNQINSAESGSADQESSPLGETEAAQDNKPESQKKTLKVKRASAAQSARPSVGGSATMFTPPTATVTIGEPEPHWIFSIITIAATLVAGVLIYVLTAQVLDVDQAEAPPSDEGLPWPARYIP